MTLAKGFHSSVDSVLPSAKFDTPFMTAHSMPRSYAAAYRPGTQNNKPSMQTEEIL